MVQYWRGIYKSVVPGYHMNKEHWNSIILDGSVQETDIKRMIEVSYELTKVRSKKTKN
ncbi:MAG: MmcQ/YjbR family DNA-binding protein [Clostridiaceae bacterium]